MTAEEFPLASLTERRRAWCAGLRPEPRQTVSEWADATVQLPSFVAEPGQWRTSRTPFLREIMDCLSPRHPCKKVVFEKPVQIGATQVAANWVGFSIHRSPAAMLFFEPTIDMVKRLVKEKIDPMIQATPALQGKIKDARIRDSGNTIYRKEYLGGHVNFLWANSSTSSRSTGSPRIVLDEVDEYDQDVGNQGHPCDLIEKRAASYGRYKIYEFSTPTIDGRSRIDDEFLLGSQGRYHVPCPFCGHLQPLVWERLIYTFEGVKRPNDAAYQCESCTQLIPERHKTWMMDSARAAWVHAYPERLTTIASFHLNLLYQPYSWGYPWSRLAEDYIKAYDKLKAGDTGPMKTFRNTILALTWKETVDKVEQDVLYKRREVYEAPCPRGVVVLTAAVDVQDNRLEAEVVGWGAGEESWSVEYRIFHGSPSLPTVWMELTEWLHQARAHADGVALYIEAVGIDTGGHHTKEAYAFIERYRGVVYALKGSSEHGAPAVPMREPRRHRQFHLRLYLLGTIALKDTIFPRLRIDVPGPGCMHWPLRPEYDQAYFDGLTSEVKRPKYKPRTAVQIGYSYEKIKSANEPLDLKAYNLATLMIELRRRRTTMERLVADWEQRVARAKVRALPLPGLTEDTSGNPAGEPTSAPLPVVTLTRPHPGRRVLSQGVG